MKERAIASLEKRPEIKKKKTLALKSLGTRRTIKTANPKEVVEKRISALKEDLKKSPQGLKSVFDQNNPALVDSVVGLEKDEREIFAKAFLTLQNEAKKDISDSTRKAREALHGAVTELGHNRLLILDPNNEVVWRWMGTLKTKEERAAFNRDLKKLQKIGHEYREKNPVLMPVPGRALKQKRVSPPVLSKESFQEKVEATVFVDTDKIANDILLRWFEKLQKLDERAALAKKSLKEALDKRPGLLERGYDFFSGLFGARRGSSELRSAEINRDIHNARSALEKAEENVRSAQDSYSALVTLIQSKLLPSIENTKNQIVTLEKKLGVLYKKYDSSNEFEISRIESVLTDIRSSYKQEIEHLEKLSIPEELVDSRLQS